MAQEREPTFPRDPRSVGCGADHRRLHQIVPIGWLMSGSLVFNNRAYLSLSVSFIQMCVCKRILSLQAANRLIASPPQAQGIHLGRRAGYVGRFRP